MEPGFFGNETCRPKQNAAKQALDVGITHRSGYRGAESSAATSFARPLEQYEQQR